MHFCTERGVWILSPFINVEITLRSDFSTTSMDRRNSSILSSIVLRQTWKHVKLLRKPSVTHWVSDGSFNEFCFNRGNTSLIYENRTSLMMVCIFKTSFCKKVAGKGRIRVILYLDQCSITHPSFLNLDLLCLWWEAGRSWLTGWHLDLI